MIRIYNVSDDRRSNLTQTTPDRLTRIAAFLRPDAKSELQPELQHKLQPDAPPDSSQATQLISTNAARVIETTRRSWLGNATPQRGDTPKLARRPRFSRRPMVANLALAMNFWSTRPL